MTQRTHRLRIAARSLIDAAVIGGWIAAGHALTGSLLTGVLMAVAVVAYGAWCFADGLMNRASLRGTTEGR